MGTVFVGIAGPVDTEVEALVLDGTRWDIRFAAVRATLSRLRELVEGQDRG